MSRSRIGRIVGAGVLAVAGVGLALGFAVVLVPYLVAWYLHGSPAPASVSAQSQALHSKLLIVDLRADSLLWSRNLLRRGSWGHVDLPRLIDGNVAIQVFSVVTQYRPENKDRPETREPGENASMPPGGTDLITPLAIAQLWPPAAWTNPLERALYQADKLAGFVRRSSSGLMAVRSGPDIDQLLVARMQAQGNGLAPPVGTLLAIEGMAALAVSPHALDRLFDAGFRIVGIGTADDRASQPGVATVDWVRRIEARQMILDAANLSEAALADVLAAARRPVIVSHTGVRGTCDRSENLSDAALRAIAASGGLIGIGFSPAAVCTASVEAIAAAIRHAVDVAGVDHVAFGSDFDGSVGGPIDVAGMVRLTQALAAAGFSDAEITKIAGANALRVLRALLPS